MRTTKRWLRSAIPTLPTNNTLIDDRLLIASLLGSDVRFPKGSAVHTTAYWYFRACRAAVAGGAGQLSGPFVALPAAQQALAIQGLLTLPDDIGLPDSRSLVPEMAVVARRHPRLNLLNIEAAAAARLLTATVVLSPQASGGVLPDALDAEGIQWQTMEPR